MTKTTLTQRILIVLLLFTAIVAAIHFATRTNIPDGILQIEYNGTVTEFSLETLPLTPVQGTVYNGKGDKLSVEGQGILLSAVLTQAGINSFTQVTVTADDEYRAVLTAEEIAETDRVFLLAQETGGIRLVVFGDSNSKRNVTNVKAVSAS